MALQANLMSQELEIRPRKLEHVSYSPIYLLYTTPFIPEVSSNCRVAHMRDVGAFDFTPFSFVLSVRIPFNPPHLPFNPQFRPFDVKHLTTSVRRAILSGVCRRTSSPISPFLPYTNLYPLSLTPKSHGIISFTDPHPLTLLESYRFKNSGRGYSPCFNSFSCNT